MQERAARAEVRPDAVLQAGHHDDVELAADEGRRRGDQHGLGAAPRGERVLGQLAGQQLVDEAHGGRVGLALHVSGGGGEERHGRVERPVRLLGEHSGAPGLCAPLRGEPAAVPERPEHLLDRAAGLGDVA